MSRMRPQKPPKDGEDYIGLWTEVDGAVRACIRDHPEYFREDRISAMRLSLAKRIVGHILGRRNQDLGLKGRKRRRETRRRQKDQSP